jgi:hypothetical protein
MDLHKIENFERLHGVLFPPIDSLTATECAALASRMKQKLGVDVHASDLELVNALDAKQQVLDGIDADDPGFDLAAACPHPVTPGEPVLINWYRFDDVDRLEFGFVRSFLSDLWYPSSDDIDIFDEQLSWVVSISHHGVVKRVTFGEVDRGPWAPEE